MSDFDRHPIVGPPHVKDDKRKALIIGISKYDHSNKFRDLDFCENDGNEVYKILKDQGYDIPENAKLVGRVEWSKMREQIIDFFTDRTLKPEDTLFFYFSGHGYLDKNTGHTYLSTSEIHPDSPRKKGFPFEELTACINDSNSERTVAVLDCCYSGALEVGGKGADEGEDEESAKTERGEELASLATTNVDRTVNRLIKSGQGKCVLASSLEEQRSFKMQDLPYSTFTYFLIEGLRGANGESVDPNGYVTPELLGSYVNKKILELETVKQKPVRKIEATGQLVLAYYPNLVKPQRDYLLRLLKEGKIEAFNEIRRSHNYSKLNFYDEDLSKRHLESINLNGVDLTSADLGQSDLTKANLTEVKLFYADLSFANLLFANLSGANLSNAKLFHCIFRGADLSNANLSNAHIAEANLSNGDLSNANLSNGDFRSANLSGANLSGANLESSLIIGVTSREVAMHEKSGGVAPYPKCEGANFKNAIIDQADLCSYFRMSNAKNVPHWINDRKELRQKLEKKGFDSTMIHRYLSFSSLPD